MGTMLLVHIAMGALALGAGFVALYAAKGALLHRRSGMLFVVSMVAMAALGTILAVVRDKGPEVNIPAAVLTSYLVITALTTVRPAAGSRRLQLGAMAAASAVAATMVVFAIQAFANGGKRDGFPAFPFVLFATIASLGVAGDLRVLRSGALAGGARLARHLWRMSMALFIAAISFTVQLPKFLPPQLRIPWLLMLPIVAVLATMGYWLWRVRGRRSLRGIVLPPVPARAIVRVPLSP